MTQIQHVQRSRTPKNSVGGGTLPLRLSPDERVEVESMAEAECRSASNMVRIIFLRGLETMKPTSTKSSSEEEQ